MSAWWKSVGISYIRYSAITSNVLRSVVRPEMQKAALARGVCNISVTHESDRIAAAVAKAKK